MHSSSPKDDIPHIASKPRGQLHSRNGPRRMGKNLGHRYFSPVNSYVVLSITVKNIWCMTLLWSFTSKKDVFYMYKRLLLTLSPPRKAAQVDISSAMTFGLPGLRHTMFHCLIFESLFHQSFCSPRQWPRALRGTCVTPHPKETAVAGDLKQKIRKW